MWSQEQITALNSAAADGLATIDRRDGGIFVITAPDFVPLFRRMAENLVIVPNTAELPKERVLLQN